MAPKISMQTLNQLRQAKAGSYEAGSEDVQGHTLYDTLNFQAAAAGTTLTFFSAPQSSNKTLQQTNMTSPGQLPAGQAFLAKAIGLHPIFNLDAATDADVAAYYKVMENANVRLIITGREFDYEAPGCNFLPSVSMVGLSTSAIAARVGDFEHHNWVKFDPGIPIGELVSFKVNISFDANATGVSAALTALAGTAISQLRVKIPGLLVRAK